MLDLILLFWSLNLRQTEHVDQRVFPASLGVVKLLNITGLPRTLAYNASLILLCDHGFKSSNWWLFLEPRMATSSVQRILFDLSSVDKMQHPRSPDSPGDKRKQIRINTNNNKCRANIQSATVATDENCHEVQTTLPCLPLETMLAL